ncbi:MAG TPA: TetR/AcrR family transcriptional regulator, partial [Kineosporiaceae bacterium]|nr:TetR/AcrR family transcriptional regulator [Kineosporiaceae bacterium]
MTGPNGGDRLERRKARTRAALIAAARDVIARDGSPSVSIQQITDAADVGFGSFYNHFSSKDELFEAAIAEAFEELGVWLDEVLAGISDPAEIFATAVR